MRYPKQKLNRTGFTMVELLTTIVILSILMIGAIIGIRAILDNAKKSYYTSQNKTMVLAGQSYVQENRNALPKTLGRSTKIPLKKLKDQNYIKEVVDYNKKSCDLDKSYIKIYKYSEKDYSYMAYMVCPSYTSKEETYANGPTITIDFKSAYDVAKADVTMSDPDKVISYSYIIYKDGVEVKNSGMVNAGLQKEVRKSLSLKEYVPAEIKITVVATDIYGNVSKKTVSEKIKDTIPPTCGTITGASTTWTNQNRKITVLCSDTGSGCERADYTKTFKTNMKVGTITIKDKAGNARDCSVNAYIDKTAPTCTSSGGSTTWANGNKTLTGTCSDTGGSGCRGNVTKPYTGNTNVTGVSPGTVYDNAGNSATCPANQTVKIDITAPTCTSSGGNAAWTNGNRTLTGTCSDTGGSGCKGNVTKPFTSNTNTATASPGTVSDNAGNSATCPANQTVKIDKTSPTCSSSGGSDAWTSTGRTLIGTCSDTGGSGCKGNVSWLINWDGNWTNLSPGTVYDNAGNSVTCPANQTVRVSTKPARPSIYNPTGGNWVNYNFSLTVSTTTAAELIGYWQYSYDNANWITDGGAGQNNYTTQPFVAERNQAAYIRVCSRQNVCSDSASTMIRIDKTAPTLGYQLINDVTGAAHANGTWSRNGLYRKLYPGDNASGVNVVQYNTGSGWNTEGNVASWWIGQGTGSVQFRVRDNAGNYSSPITITTLIDWEAPYYTSVSRVCGGGYGQSWRFYVNLEFSDNISGVGQRNVDWYTDRWHNANGSYGGDRHGSDNIGTWGNLIKFYHTVCDIAGNCNSWNDDGVYGNGC